MRAFSFALMAAACVLAAVIVPRFHPSAQVCVAVERHNALKGRFDQMSDVFAKDHAE